jgi:hypothetical protein
MPIVGATKQKGSKQCHEPSAALFTSGAASI